MARDEKALWQAELSHGQLLCRDISHQWEYSTAERSAEGFDRVLICVRCETTRIQKLDHEGYPIGAKYHYSEGYVAPKGNGRYTREARAELRLMSLNARTKGQRRKKR